MNKDVCWKLWLVDTECCVSFVPRNRRCTSPVPDTYTTRSVCATSANSRKNSRFCGDFFGGRDRDRTCDPSRVKVGLSLRFSLYMYDIFGHCVVALRQFCANRGHGAVNVGLLEMPIVLSHYADA